MPANAPTPPACDCDVIHEDVVNRVRAEMPEGNDFYELADLYKMFSDSTRVRILWALEISEMCVCDLAVLLGLTKSAVSHQLRDMRLSCLVKFRKEGKTVYYSLSDEHVKAILDVGMLHIEE